MGLLAHSDVAIKRNKTLPFAAPGTDLEGLVLHEMRLSILPPEMTPKLTWNK